MLGSGVLHANNEITNAAATPEFMSLEPGWQRFGPTMVIRKQKFVYGYKPEDP